MPDAPAPSPSQTPAQPVDRAVVLVLVRDLMFSSRIAATARAADVAVKLLREPTALAGTEGRLLIVDLNQAGALDAAVAWKRQSAREVVGFVSHVDAETISRARSAGIDHIMARSQFVNVLGNLLRR